MTTTISNPPYNMKWQHPFFAQSQARFDYGVPPESNANFAFIETALSQSNEAVLLLPNGILSTNQKDELAIKKNLCEQNMLETVIALPNDMFESTGIPTCLLIFNHKKETQKVQMIDLSDQGVKETREQRGQFGGKSHTNRVYTKEINTLSDGTIQKVLEIIKNQIDKTDFSQLVSLESIRNNDYNLAPKRYIEIDFGEAEHRSYKDIIADLNRIIESKNGLKITINENMAKSLGVYDLAMDFKRSKEINKAMNEMISSLDLGTKIKNEDVVTLSRNKELKFEVKNFDRMPELVNLFMTMWTQFIMTANNEENRLLVELRDALLPDLMTGKIEVGE